MGNRAMKIEDICKVSSSKRIFAREYVETGVPFWRGKEVTEHATGKNDSKGLFISVRRYNELKQTGNVPSDDDVLITAVGTIGSIYQIKHEDLPFYFKDGNIIRLSNWNTERVNPTYVSLFLRSQIGQQAIKEVEIGSTQKALTIKDIAKVPILLPELKTQNDIAAAIGFIDAKIKINQQINKNLLELIDNIYIREYFANSQVVLADHVALSDLVQTKTKTFNPKKTSETLVNHFSMPAFDEAHYPIIDKVTSIKSNKNIVEPFSVLVSKMNPQVKRVWLPNISDKILNVASTEFLTFNADSAEMQAFIYAIVNNKSYKQFLMSNTTGSTNSRQRVLPRVAYSFEIAFNRIKAERLGKLLVPFLEKIKLTKSEIQRLKKLRALLLPKLLSGSINLSSMEEAMKNA